MGIFGFAKKRKETKAAGLATGSMQDGGSARSDAPVTVPREAPATKPATTTAPAKRPATKKPKASKKK